MSIKSDMKMIFGKHVGKLLHNIPVGYVQWIVKNDVLKHKNEEFFKEFKRVWKQYFFVTFFVIK